MRQILIFILLGLSILTANAEVKSYDVVGLVKSFDKKSIRLKVSPNMAVDIPRVIVTKTVPLTLDERAVVPIDANKIRLVAWRKMDDSGRIIPEAPKPKINTLRKIANTKRKAKKVRVNF